MKNRNRWLDKAYLELFFTSLTSKFFSLLVWFIYLVSNRASHYPCYPSGETALLLLKTLFLCLSDSVSAPKMNSFYMFLIRRARNHFWAQMINLSHNEVRAKDRISVFINARCEIKYFKFINWMDNHKRYRLLIADSFSWV